MKVFFVMIIWACVMSCSVTFVPKYNQSIIDQVTSTAKTTDSLFNTIQLSNNRTFTSYTSVYVSIESNINSILMQDIVRNKPKYILIHIQSILDVFKKYQLDHKTKMTLTPGEAQSYKNSMFALWQILLVSETSLNK